VSAEPIAKSVYLGQMEARNRALSLLLHGRGLESNMMISLNRIRRRSERWTDMLLGYVAAESDVNQYGHESSRVRQFAEDIREQRGLPNQQSAWVLLAESATEAFRTEVINQAANSDLNRDIATSLSRCFDIDIFEGTGIVAPLWETRLMHEADNVQSLVDQLLSPEELADIPSSESIR